MTWIDARELDERVIEREELARSWLGGADPIVQHHLHARAGTLGGLMFAGVIDEDATHHLRRYREEVRAILPGDAVLLHEPHEGLMHQRRWLKCVIGPLATQVRASPSLQFAVNDRHEIVARLLVAAAPCFQQAADRASLTRVLVHYPSATVSTGRLGAVVRQCTPAFRVSTQLPIKPGREDQGDEMRELTLLMLMLGVMLGHSAGASGLAQTAESVDPTEIRIPRVRSESVDIAAVIRRAAETSATFRRLMATIDATNGLVYVDNGKCGHSVRACLLLAVQIAGPSRILQIKIDARQLDCHLMGQLGHELQHAVEVLSDPHVTNGALAYFLYDRIARKDPASDREWFETPAAQRAGDDVRHETCSGK